MAAPVLIIAYYFPPLGMGGVQRMAKLAKYLPVFGYEVSVLTVKPVEYPAYDESLLDDLPRTVNIFRSGSSDPARISKIIPGLSRVGPLLKTRVKKKGLVWPDSKIGWKKPAVRLAEKIIDRNRFDAIISSSPPITAHLVAMELKRKYNMSWIADFRDFWESYPPEMVYGERELIDKSYALMAEIGREADAVTAVTGSIGESITSDVHVIHGGYDEDDFMNIPGNWSRDQFIVTFLGTEGPLHPLEPFLEALAGAVGKSDELERNLRVHIIGVNDSDKISSLAARYDLESKINMIGYLSHHNALEKAAEAAVLLVSLPDKFEGLLPGKMFDCLALPGAVLASVPGGGETEKYIQRFEAGLTARPDDIEGLTRGLLQIYDLWKRVERWPKKNIKGATRRLAAQQFSVLLDEIRKDK